MSDDIRPEDISAWRLLIVWQAHTRELEEELARLQNIMCAMAFDRGRTLPVKCFWCKADLGEDEEFIRKHTQACAPRLEVAS